MKECSERPKGFRPSPPKALPTGPAPPPPLKSISPVYLATARALCIRPGDKIVVSLPFKANPERLERIKVQFVPLFPGHQIIVLEEGMKVGVMRAKR